MITMRQLSLIFFILFSASTVGEVLWYGDPNNSITSNFRRFDTTGGEGPSACGVDNPPEPTVTTPTDPSFGKVWRITKPVNRKRAEFARTSFIPSDGDLLYYGWRWKISSSPEINGGIAV